MYKDWFVSWGLLILSVVFNAIGALAIKSKLNELGVIKLDTFQSVWSVLMAFLRSPLVVVSTILFFISPFLFAAALSKLPLTLAYPVQIGLNFLLVLGVSVFLMNEKMTALQFAGVVFIVMGIIMLNKFSS